MANNKPLRRYHTIGMIIAPLLAGFSGVKGFFIGLFLNWAARYLAREGVYLIDVGATYIATNMDEKNWLKVNGESYEQVAKGVTHEQGQEIDRKFIKAFDRFVVFKRVRKL